METKLADLLVDIEASGLTARIRRNQELGQYIVQIGPEWYHDPHNLPKHINEDPYVATVCGFIGALQRQKESISTSLDSAEFRMKDMERKIKELEEQAQMAEKTHEREVERLEAQIEEEKSKNKSLRKRLKEIKSE